MPIAAPSRGPVTSSLSDGCHRLIQDGALLVTRTEEVLEAVGRLGIDLAIDRASPCRRRWCTGRRMRREIHPGRSPRHPASFRLGEGLVGQVAAGAKWGSAHRGGHPRAGPAGDGRSPAGLIVALQVG
jgi:hypothetical protein